MSLVYYSMIDNIEKIILEQNKFFLLLHHRQHTKNNVLTELLFLLLHHTKHTKNKVTTE